MLDPHTAQGTPGKASPSLTGVGDEPVVPGVPILVANGGVRKMAPCCSKLLMIGLARLRKERPSSLFRSGVCTGLRLNPVVAFGVGISWLPRGTSASGCSVALPRTNWSSITINCLEHPFLRTGLPENRSCNRLQSSALLPEIRTSH